MPLGTRERETCRSRVRLRRGRSRGCKTRQEPTTGRTRPTAHQRRDHHEQHKETTGATLSLSLSLSLSLRSAPSVLLNKEASLFQNPRDHSVAYVAPRLRRVQGEAFSRLSLDFCFLAGRPVTLKNVEHCLCEFAKYKSAMSGGRTFRSLNTTGRRLFFKTPRDSFETHRHQNTFQTRTNARRQAEQPQSTET